MNESRSCETLFCIMHGRIRPYDPSYLSKRVGKVNMCWNGSEVDVGDGTTLNTNTAFALYFANAAALEHFQHIFGKISPSMHKFLKNHTLSSYIVEEEAKSPLNYCSVTKCSSNVGCIYNSRKFSKWPRVQRTPATCTLCRKLDTMQTEYWMTPYERKFLAFLCNIVRGNIAASKSCVESARILVNYVTYCYQPILVPHQRWHGQRVRQMMDRIVAKDITGDV